MDTAIKEAVERAQYLTFFLVNEECAISILKVREIIEGPVVSEVDVETPAGLIVTSVITTRSVHELGLKVGKDVVALVKSTEVSIATL